MPTQAERREAEAERQAREAEHLAVETETPIVLIPEDARQARKAGLIYWLAAPLAPRGLGVFLTDLIHRRRSHPPRAVRGRWVCGFFG